MKKDSSAEDIELLQKLKEATSKGKDVEVKRNKDGSLKLLAIDKKIL